MRLRRCFRDGGRVTGLIRPGRVTFALLILLLGVAAFTVTACGDDDDGGQDTTDAPIQEGAESAAETAEEAADDAASEAEQGVNELAPSGDAVRAEKVEIVDFSYDPDPVTIEVGGKVTWINRDSEAHTATSEDATFDTGILEQGKLRSENFKEAGEYAYLCELHPSMGGTVEVVESG